MGSAAFKPTAKKCSGESHWYPARSGVFGTEVLFWEKFDTPAKATAAARKYLTATPAPREEPTNE